MGLEIDILTQGKAMQDITLAQFIDFVVFREGFLYGCSGIDDMKLRIGVITLTKHVSPAVLLVYLVNDKHLATTLDKLTGKFYKAASLKIKT